MIVRKAMTAAALVALTTGAALAADQTILGKSFVVKSPSTPDHRKITMSARETGSPNNIVGDPTASGASLTVKANGGTSTMQTFVLNQGTSSTGRPFWRASGSTGFKYSDSKGDQSAVKSVIIKKSPSGLFIIKVKVNGKLDGGTVVVPPNPGTDGCVALAINSGDIYDVKFGTDSTIKNQDGKLFKAKNPQSEGTCGVTTTTTITLPTTTSSSSLTLPTTTSTSSSASSSTSTTASTTTTTTLYGSPSRAFTDHLRGLLD
jgi:hypothetical protein